MESRRDRHLKVRCNICNRCMRSDTLKRHSESHRDILAMSEEEIRDELKTRNTMHMQREERLQKVMEKTFQLT